MRILITNIIFLLFFIPSAFGFNLSVSVSAGSGSWSNGAYEINKGASVNFSVTATDGTAPYTYCWNFGYKENDASLGTWNNSANQICYSTTQNPTSITFNDYGEYPVELYVQDSLSNSERAIILIKVNVSGTTLNAVTDCGLDNGGSTDNGTDLASCISGTGGNIIIQFPTGSYRFTATNAISGKDVKLESVSGQNATIVFDPPGTFSSTNIPFLTITSGNLYIDRMVFEHDLDGNDQSVEPRCNVVKTLSGGHVIFQNNTVYDFTTPFRYLSGIVLKNNLIDWGSGSNCSAVAPYRISLSSGSGAYDYGNLYWAYNYTKTESCHEHFVYLHDNMVDEFKYYIKNYIDFSNWIDTANVLNYWNNDTHFIGNYVYDGSQFVNNGANSEFIGNTFNGWNNIYIISLYTGVNNINFDYNNLMNIQRSVNYEYGTGHTAIGNNFGLNAGSPYWGILGDSCAATTLNPGDCTRSTVTDNTDNSTDYSISDPGPWEFTPPTLTSATKSGTTVTAITVNTTGSGMGSTARWPFSNASLYQVSSDGQTWSEVRDYSATPGDSFSINPNYIRIFDVDHNVSTPLLATEGGDTTPPTISGTPSIAADGQTVTVNFSETVNVTVNYTTGDFNVDCGQLKNNPLAYDSGTGSSSITFLTTYLISKDATCDLDFNNDIGTIDGNEIDDNSDNYLQIDSDTPMTNASDVLNGAYGLSVGVEGQGFTIRK